MRRLVHVRDLPRLCARRPAGDGVAGVGRRGCDARRHRQPAPHQQPPLLPAHRIAGNGRARRLPAGNPNLMPDDGIVIVGAGHAGFQLAASLRQHGYGGAVPLVGDEPVLPYQRPPLSKDYLDGKIGLDLLLMRREAFNRDHRIGYLPGARVMEIDRAARAVRLATGERLSYSHLVLATGARNRVPPLPGIELDGVCYLRTLAETEELQERLATCRHAVIIGAGFIGLEFAAIARSKNVSVHIVELTERVMGRVVCPETSAYFADAHRKT